MRRPRLFCPTLSTGLVRLSAEESHHATASLRASAGQEVILFDGAGTEAVGAIVRIGGRPLCGRRSIEIEVETLTTVPFALSCRLTLAVAMGRGHRQGYLIEKCTELGVAAIWPVMAERSVSKPGSDAVAKWTRRAIEAAKQSEQAWVPTISPPQTFQESLHHAPDFDAATLLDAGRGEEANPLGGGHGPPHKQDTGETLTPFSALLARQPESSTVLIWVGPEGGWSKRERLLATEAGIVRTSLGPTILRTETAAVAACAAGALDTASRRQSP